MLKKFILLCLILPTIALAQSFIEGKDYQVITNPQVANNKNAGPVIIEFFSFGCPWCYKMEKPLTEWRGTLKKNIQFESIPVVFKPSWELYAKAYYTAKILALSDKMNPLLFKAIQEEKKPLDSKEAMISFFVAQGVNKEITQSAFENSPTIDMHVQNGMSLMGAYQINAVPAFVVNNKYKTDLQMAGNPERLLELLDYLSQKS